MGPIHDGDKECIILDSCIVLHQIMLLCFTIAEIGSCFFMHTDIHIAAIVGMSAILFILNFHTQWGSKKVAEIYILHLLNTLGGIQTCVPRVRWLMP